MRNMRKASMSYPRAILFTALAVVSIVQAASQARAQAPPAAPASGAETSPEMSPEMSPDELKMMLHSLDEPRAISAAIIAADGPAPKYIVNDGAAKGWFLEVYLDKFPKARGQWTESDLPDHNLSEGKELLGRFGDRVDYKLGCTNRDLTQGCMPKGTDVIITEWLSLHQNLDMMYKDYRAAFAQLPAGGWFVNIDRVGFGGSAWESRLKKASPGFRPTHDGPPIERSDFRLPTIDEELRAMRAAGFDAQVVWQSFGTVLFMGRKN